MGWISPASLAKAPLLFHAVLETAASLSFALQPERQLPGANEDARAVLLNYSGLLLSTNILAVLFAWRTGFDDATRLVAACLAVYHVFPILRASVKIRRGIGLKPGEKARVLGGPQIHAMVHGACLVGLILAALLGTGGDI